MHIPLHISILWRNWVEQFQLNYDLRSDPNITIMKKGKTSLKHYALSTDECSFKFTDLRSMLSERAKPTGTDKLVGGVAGPHDI